MTETLPSVFIGSSSEGLDIAREIELQLQHDALTTIWKDGVFGLGGGTLESLMSSLERFDFAVMVLSPDDLLESRNESYVSPRDNVIFELGLFMGRLGRRRTFIVHEREANLKLPSDLSGIAASPYRRRDNLSAALSPTCTSVIKTIRSLGPFGALEYHTDPSKKRSRAFWKPLVEDGLEIVLGRFREFMSFEQSGVLGVGDAIAMMELRTHLESVGLPGVQVSYADRLSGDALKGNLVLLGGPDANRVTRQVTRRIQSTLRFGDPDRNIIALFDSESGRQLVPRKSCGGVVENDYGIIFYGNNPFSTGKKFVLSAGSFGYGTWAGIRFILSEGFLNNSLVQDKGEVECLIETDVVLETPQGITVHAIRRLHNAA